MRLPKYVREKLLILLPDAKIETYDQAIKALNQELAQYQLDGILDDDIITLTQMVTTFSDNFDDDDIVDSEFCSYFDESYSDLERLQDDIREYQKQENTILSTKPNVNDRKDLEINRYKGHRARVYCIERAVADKCTNYYVEILPSGISIIDKGTKKTVLKYSEIFEYKTIIYGAIRFYQPNDMNVIEDVLGTDFVYRRACRQEPNMQVMRLAYYTPKEAEKIVKKIYSYNNGK